MHGDGQPALLILNQMAGPMTWQFAEDFAETVGPVAMLTGHPDTLSKGSRANLRLFPSTPHTKGTYPQRFVSWIRYCIQAACWLRRWPAKTPILVFSTPPLLPWLAWLFRMTRGHRYAVMVHDVYPDVLVGLRKLPESHVVAQMWRSLNRAAYERAELVMTLGDHMARRLRASFDPARTEHGRVEVISPWADTDEIQPVPKTGNWFAAKFDQLSKLTVMYSGNMGFSHDIATMLLAAEKLRERHDIHFMFIGSGPKWQSVADVIEQKHLTNVTLLPWQAEEVVPFSLTAADVAFVSLREELTGTMLPSKAFSFMAAGVPLLVSSGDDGELPDLVAKFGLGWRIRPGDAEAVCAIIGRAREGGQLQAFRTASRAAAEKIGSRRNSRVTAELLARTFRIPHTSIAAGGASSPS